MAVNQAFLSYPGIIAWESFDFTDLCGITPAVCTIKCFPQDFPPDANGDLVISYNGNIIVIPNMHLDAIQYQANGGGKICSVRLLDERWAWTFFQITGHYNIKLPNGLVNPAHEVTTQALAIKCFEEMYVDNYDVSQLPDLARPEVDWESANAAQELQELVDSLGCKIVPQRSTGTWVICNTGVGNNLPDGLPYQDYGNGIDPKETPDYLKVVTAPIRYQVCLGLEPIGRDVNNAWTKMQDLSYKPLTTLAGVPLVTGLPDSACGEFGFDWVSQSHISAVRAVQPNGSAKSPREFALSTVFKNWRIDDTPTNASNSIDEATGENSFFLPGYNDMVTRKQLVVTDELVESYQDELDVDHARPAFITGRFFGAMIPRPNPNYPPGTRIDKQARNPDGGDTEEPASFSMSIDDIDTDRTICTTSKPMLTFYDRPKDSPLSSFGVAYLFLTCAVQVRDPDNWQPIRYERLLQIGNGSNPDFCQVLIKEDIMPWVINEYYPDGTQRGSISFDYVDPINNNKQEVDAMCDYYLQQYANTFYTVASQTRTYIGLFPIDMDGAIAQVTYRSGKGGHDTIVSRGTEHKFEIPSYEQRLQREGRKGKDKLAKYMEYRANRRMKLLGNNNTI